VRGIFRSHVSATGNWSSQVRRRHARASFKLLVCPALFKSRTRFGGVCGNAAVVSASFMMRRVRVGGAEVRLRSGSAAVRKAKHACAAMHNLRSAVPAGRDRMPAVPLPGPVQRGAR